MSMVLTLVLYVSMTILAYDKISIIANLDDTNLKNAIKMDIKNDKVYVLCQNSIRIYGIEGKDNKKNLMLEREIPLSIQKPKALAVKNENEIYVLGTKISVIDGQGKTIFEFAEQGSMPSQLSSPSDIIYDNDLVYVADTSNSRISVYSQYGIFLYDFPINDGISSLKPIKIFTDPYGYIYVIEENREKVFKYSLRGEKIKTFNLSAFPIVINDYGFAYGVINNKIYEYNNDFIQRGLFGTKGKNVGEFNEIADIKPYESGICVLDKKNSRITIFNIENKGFSKITTKKIKLENEISITPHDIIYLNSDSFIPINGKILYFTSSSKNCGISIRDVVKNSDEKIIPCGEKEIEVKEIPDLKSYGNSIYLVDTQQGKIKILENLKFKNAFGSKVGLFSGEKEGKFARAVSIDVDENDKIYVLDSNLLNVSVFNPDGIFLYSFNVSDKKETIGRPISLIYDKKIYVLFANLIKVFSSDGKFEKIIQLGNIKNAISFDKDGYGYFYILDLETSRVYVLDVKKEKIVSSFFGKGNGVREFLNPYVIRYLNGKLYIGDKNGKISIFSLKHIAYIKEPQISIGKDGINLSWHFDGAVERFDVFRSTDAKNFFCIFTTTENFISDTLSQKSTYYYKIKSISVDGYETESDIISVYYEKTKEIEETKTSDDNISKNRAPVEIIPVELNYIFSSNYKYYLKNPIGSVKIINNTPNNFENMKLSFFIKEYMDFPYDILISSLPANSSKNVDINATLNSKIISITEITPVQARISLEYYSDGEKKETSLNIPVKILSRNSMVWSQPERIASFVTINDPKISTIAKMISAKKDDIKTNVDENIKIFSLIKNYISMLGIKYVEDPITPYKISRTSETIIDSILFPRNLLQIKAGDCDDLTVLFVSLLEACGIETVMLDYGNHITAMFALKEPKSMQNFIEGMKIDYENKDFIPFEVTMLDKDLFSNISYAQSYYRSKKDVVRFYHTRQLMSVYEPPTFSDTDIKDIDIPSDIVVKAQSDLYDFEKKYYDFYEEYYKAILKEDPLDYDAKLNLGILYGLEGRYDEAKKLFDEILSENQNDPNALNNLGNILYLLEKYEDALSFHQKASQYDPYDADILINIVNDYIKLGNKDAALTVFEKATRLKPELKKMQSDIFK